MTDLSRCRTCQGSLPDAARFCPRCGTPADVDTVDLVSPIGAGEGSDDTEDGWAEEAPGSRGRARSLVLAIVGLVAVAAMIVALALPERSGPSTAIEPPPTTTASPTPTTTTPTTATTTPDPARPPGLGGAASPRPETPEAPLGPVDVGPLAAIRGSLEATHLVYLGGRNVVVVDLGTGERTSLSVGVVDDAMTQFKPLRGGVAVETASRVWYVAPGQAVRVIGYNTRLLATAGAYALLLDRVPPPGRDEPVVRVVDLEGRTLASVEVPLPLKPVGLLPIGRVVVNAGPAVFAIGPVQPSGADPGPQRLADGVYYAVSEGLVLYDGCDPELRCGSWVRGSAGQARLLDARVTETIGVPAASPDGQRLVLSSAQPSGIMQVLVIAAETGATTAEVVQERSPWAAWDPGSSAYIVATANGVAFHRVNGQTSAELDLGRGAPSGLPLVFALVTAVS